ncbi:MAG: RNA methyltransferase [Acidobacteria bacterium]|nr:RNA methyltransferase [Acidobacteriota bacterium]
MAIPQITSRNNPVLKTIRLVASGSHRAPEELVVAEGLRVLEEALNAGRRIEVVLISDRFGSSKREGALLNALLPGKVRIYRADSQLFKYVSDVQSPQGAIALVRMPKLSLDTLKPAQNTLILYACGIQDPGNLGTLIRTAAAAGASFACTSRGTVSPRNPKAIRASAGLYFRLPVLESIELPAFLRYCKLHQIRVYRTDVMEGMPYTEADLAPPCALLLGNEGRGLADSGLKHIQSLHIPMAEGVESLNVASAGAVFLFEAVRQRTLPESKLGTSGVSI